MIRPDLHLHSAASDGVFSPSELARLLQRADVTCIALTDHDTVSGLAEMADAAYDRGLPLITGLEISTEGEKDIHILGYGVRPDDPRLLSFLEEMEEERVHRFFAMGKKLAALSMPLPLEEIKMQADKSIGRPHLARAMVKCGYAASVPEAFARFLGRNCPAYIPRENPPAARVIRFLRECGAIPVLAHPGLMHLPHEQLLPLLHAWQDAGLMGMEVYHPAHHGEYSLWDRLARREGLLVTGGSDFHAENDARHGSLGATAPFWPSAMEDAWRLYSLARKNTR